MFKNKNKISLYNLYTLYGFLSLRHISLGLLFDRVVIGLMEKYHLDFYGYAL
jgi:hypothetical protein